MFSFFIQDQERPAKTKLFLEKLSVSHFWIFGNLNCRLCAVIANFVFSKNIHNFSKYHHMNPKFPGNEDFQKYKKN